METRVQYISDIVPPFNIKRYTYYELLKENDKYYVVDSIGELEKYDVENLKLMFALEVGTWEEYFSVSDKKEVNKSKDKKDTKKEVVNEIVE